ncbi:AIR synthase-related protein [Methanosphaera sp. Vir-13MRS]|uniref:AIR synthase-related protein n=1 Tax=Candidatus Methanosphaera massiliense TaxID=3017187 RepID=UPI00238068D9|nr:AIR synthase-related protein [Candidatus Methanosphaera massiliense]MDE4077884.1 AIR synthase-related protein [Candidatus Methanosphaera massiliense]
MDIEEYTKTSLRNKKDKKETIEKLSKIIQYYKDITPQQAEKLSKTIYDEVNTTEQLNQDALGDLLQYPKTNIGMGEFGVGSRGQGDFYVHSKIAKIIKNTETESIVNPTAQDDGGVVKVEDTYYITTAIDGIHSRLSDYPFLAGFHTARATLRDVCVMGATPVALISDIHLADDGDIGKIFDYTAGICAVSELTGVPLVSGSTLRVGGDMVLGNRLVGAVGAVGSSNNIPKARSEAHEGDVILMTEGSGGGTITTTSIYNNYPEVIKETLNVQFVKASKLLNNYDKQEDIHAMTDITNGGINGDSNEINKTTGLGIHLYREKINELINPKVYSMLNDLDIDPLGVSIDSLMIIVSPKCVSSITQLLEETNIRVGIIGEVTGTGKTYIEDSNGEVELLTPKFREAAYTPIKKIIETINETDFEENKKIIDKSAKEAIDKKNRLVKYIEDKYE